MKKHIRQFMLLFILSIISITLKAQDYSSDTVTVTTDGTTIIIDSTETTVPESVEGFENNAIETDVIVGDTSARSNESVITPADNTSTVAEEAERVETETRESEKTLNQKEKAAKEEMKASRAELQAVRAEKKARKAERKADKAKRKAERERNKLN